MNGWPDPDPHAPYRRPTPNAGGREPHRDEAYPAPGDPAEAADFPPHHPEPEYPESDHPESGYSAPHYLEPPCPGPGPRSVDHPARAGYPPESAYAGRHDDDQRDEAYQGDAYRGEAYRGEAYRGEAYRGESLRNDGLRNEGYADEPATARASAFWDGDADGVVGGDTDPDRRPEGARRRHRAPRRTRRSALVAGAAAVATLAVAVGAGALLLPDRDRPAPAANAAADGTAGSDGTQIDAATPAAPEPPTASAPDTPAPSFSTTRTAPTTAAPARKPAATPRRTPSRPPATATGAAAAPTAQGGPEAQVVAIVNRERAANGCGAVQVNDKLAAAARLHSQDQAEHDTMSHTGSDGSSPWDRAGAAGYDQAIGENVAAGYRTPDAVMTGWMNSAGHRANILNCQAKAIGVGVAAASDGTLYWTQMFGSAI
ncbi:CAP domain-containing protein [Micromonospora sp. NPDC049559]|uniref:CAP domain-containing protein n=1 Tax=Micromonospora sp. NPDC049559 TaxID=3155923 RepID=UPI00341ACF68